MEESDKLRFLAIIMLIGLIVLAAIGLVMVEIRDNLKEIKVNAASGVLVIRDGRIQDCRDYE